MGPERKDHFVGVWINRNAKRKRPSDVLWSWKIFLDNLQKEKGHKNATLIMHTEPTDNEGPNLFKVSEMLNIQNNVFFSRERIGFNEMNILYNISDFCLNISYAEGFGLGTLESMMTGTPIIASKTGGLTRQVVNHRDGTENGVALDIVSQTLVGSQNVPYIYEDYANRIGEIVIGVVHQVQRDGVFINIEQAELRMPKSEQIHMERYRRGETVRAVIKSVEVTAKGPDIVVSRSDNHFLYKLFELEVPEIEDGIIEITSIARYPGERAKIIVKSNDRRIDPVGACVGMRGSRIQAIVRELNNEKIDIVNFSEQNEILLTRALSPAKPLQLYIDDEKRYCVALFEDDSLDAAIGRNGMNVNLASKITEYKIDAFGVQQYERIQEDQKTPISDIEGVDNKISKILEKSGISLVSDLLDSDMDSLLDLNGIDEQALDSVYESVQDYVERKIEPEKEEDEIDLSSLGIDLELENKSNSDPELELEISTSEEE